MPIFTPKDARKERIQWLQDDIRFERRLAEYFKDKKAKSTGQTAELCDTIVTQAEELTTQYKDDIRRLFNE